jgi:mannose-1-phosphate guanylyltransferase
MKIVILAGGGGTRFWPRSTPDRPKQFLAFTSSGKTMLQETWDRFRTRFAPEHIYVVTLRKYAALVAEQLPEISTERIIIEPEQRDTCPCIALSALHFLEQGKDEPIVTAPSDQFIPHAPSLCDALEIAAESAGNGHRVVTLGIRPTRPETGYGYMETAEPPDQEHKLLKVKAFIEKPSADKAKALIENGSMLWNSGICVWKPSTIAYYMERFEPEMWRSLRDKPDGLEAAYSRLPKVSVDYAILEKAEDIYTIPVSFEWDDTGLWSSLSRLLGTDASGNAAVGNVRMIHTEGSILYSERQPLVAVGVSDLIIISTGSGLLVCHKSAESLIREALRDIEKEEIGF